ncbi:esterase [Erythrobacter sp. SG61-1L]|uniref:alpha/beta hydrolase n=1 Tax=Erythrobacter sp. SG61-1L TaxID=1603897 RepID=UPI0006C9065E|nr:alpha/beta hydrolase-fold protein [Erythrobacter sp. SG61-1L]KPL69490.1 esterase [Erythrobacter sp. SG61-1L]
MKYHASFVAALCLSGIAATAPLSAQTGAQDAPKSCLPQGFFAGPATYRSVEQLPDGRVIFRLCAPAAHDARVTSSDIDQAIPMGMQPGTQRGLAMVKDETGLWSATTAVPVPPDTYRFNFEVDGARVPDPQGTTFSHERVGTNSTFETKGAEGAFQTYRSEVAHGAVSRIDYWSNALGQKRQAYVYTPPGYMKDGKSYPVLYLVHGAGDSADSWTSVGHANYILDNLIAEGKATPMIVVMPFGHTPDKPGGNMLANTDFGDDLLGDLIPYVDASFRTLADQHHRAMAGLSMGGSHTLRFGLTHPETFDYIGIFSMGLGLAGPDDVTRYESANDAALRKAASDLDLVYYAMGREDFLYGSVAPTRAMLDKYGIEHTYHESGGGHTWINWRRYLADFAPRLFR